MCSFSCCRCCMTISPTDLKYLKWLVKAPLDRFWNAWTIRLMNSWLLRWYATRRGASWKKIFFTFGESGQWQICNLTCYLVSRFHHQALVELKILDVIKRKDKDNLHNVIHMKEYFYFRNHLCISFELLGLVYALVFWGFFFCCSTSTKTSTKLV